MCFFKESLKEVTNHRQTLDKEKLTEDAKVVGSDVSELSLRTDRSAADSGNTEKRAQKLVADAEDFDRSLNSVIQSSEGKREKIALFGEKKRKIFKKFCNESKPSPKIWASAVCRQKEEINCWKMRNKHWTN